MGEEVEVGLLFSTSGSYRALGQALLRGALLAIEEVNTNPEIGLRLKPTIVNPEGRLSNYRSLGHDLLCRRNIKHIIGCYTSSSRKEVLPLFEKHDGLLWYPSHYEGFETSDNIIYTGAAPNQHIVPLAQHLLQNCGRRAWLIGSNYIWAWENNRILREATQDAGGEILGERYLPIGDADLEWLIHIILDDHPDFIFNTMIGESAYAFFRTFARICSERGLKQESRPLIASCSLSEPELLEIGPGADLGHLSSSVYFETLDTPENEAFVSAWRRRFPGCGPTSADAEAAYNTVQLFARSVKAAGSQEVAAVREASASVLYIAPQGRIHIDGDNHHCYLTPRIGRSIEGGRFEVIYEAKIPVRPDPYLLWHSPRVSACCKPPSKIRAL